MTPPPPLVIWTLTARRRLRQALARTIVQKGPTALDAAMNNLEGRLHLLFPNARAVVVQEQYVGYRPRDNEYILLVEVDGCDRAGRHVVKLADDAQRLADECAAWESCRPHGLRHDLVFMTLEACPGPDGQIAGLIYSDAQQFLGVSAAVSLEHAFLGAVRHGAPSAASVASVLGQLYERIGHLFYPQSFVEDPDDKEFVFGLRPLVRSIREWDAPGSDAARARQDVHTSAKAGRGQFRDPVDYLRFLTHVVRWHEPLDGAPAQPAEGAPRPGLCLPRMLRGCAHGDLHGRNVLVGVVHERALWPAVFDYEHMGPNNRLGWDFVKMETELKVPAYRELFPGDSLPKFIAEVQKFEIELAERTENHNLGLPWPESADGANPRERLLALLLALRGQAALHLGSDRGRPRDWLGEYYFLMGCYGVGVVRFSNVLPRERVGAYVSAGVSMARFLWDREDSILEAAGSYPSYHRPLEQARAALRAGGEQRTKAIPLLQALRGQYGHVLAVAQELVLALLEGGRLTDALTELDAIDRKFGALDEETLCRRGRFSKEAGDAALAAADLEQADVLYRRSVSSYDRAYALHNGHYPGINAAALRLLLAGVARARGHSDESAALLRQAEEQVRELLALRAQNKWANTLPDDDVWHLATAGEAHLLLQEWGEAAKTYRRAFEQPAARPFHRESAGKQARRILDAWGRLDVTPDAAEFPLDSIFSAPDGEATGAPA